MNNTLLANFLTKLNYKYTNRTIQEFQQNPLKDNLLGISQVLFRLGIETDGYKLSDTKDLESLKTPFITIKNKKFAIISNISKKIVYYTIGKHSHIEDFQTFANDWSYTVLVVVDIHRNQEPNYSGRKRNESKLLFTKYFAASIGIITVFLFGYLSGFWDSLESIILLILNIIGLLFSGLLYIEYLDIDSDITKKFCGIIKDADCNKVSTSRGSKILNLFHLSEIGCSFFLVNIIAIAVFNINTSILSIVSACTLAFCLWSPLYQKFFVKRWCPLCLLTALTLIIQFLYILLTGIIDQININQFNVCFIANFCLICCCYTSTIIIMFYLSKFYKNYLQNKYLVRDYKELKYRTDVSELLLNSEHKLTSPSDTTLVFGNSESNKVVTVVSNPFCISCMPNHSELNKFNLMDYRIEYVLTSFSKDLLYVNYKIVAYYKQFGANKTWDLLTKWYEDREKQPSFFNEFNLNSIDGKEEVARQLSWITKENIASTPSVFLNGRKLPIQYSISDIPYFYGIIIKDRF